jgi:hypothetical protein
MLRNGCNDSDPVFIQQNAQKIPDRTRETIPVQNRLENLLSILQGEDPARYRTREFRVGLIKFREGAQILRIFLGSALFPP